MILDLPTVLWLICFPIAFYFMYLGLLHETQ